MVLSFRSKHMKQILTYAVFALAMPYIAVAQGYTWPNFVSMFDSKNCTPSTACPYAGTRINMEGCNTVSYGSTPNLGGLMIGRMMNGDPALQGNPSGCTFAQNVAASSPLLQWSLTAVQIDFASARATYLYKILDTATPVSVESGAYTIYSAYDATVVPFQGEYWVSFECALVNGATSSCIGPLAWNKSLNQLSMDTSRISVVAQGRCGSTGNCLSASLPKLLTTNGQLFMYWDDLTMANPSTRQAGQDSQTSFLSENSRGAQLSKNPSTGLIHVSGHTSPIVENDDSSSVTVLNNGALMQVLAFNGIFLATGALEQAASSASAGCVYPLANYPNCFRLFFAQAQSPLGAFQLIPSESGGMLADIVAADGLPNDPSDYLRWVYRQDTGQTELMGGEYIVYKTDTNMSQYNVAHTFLPWPDNLLRPTCGGEMPPYPNQPVCSIVPIITNLLMSRTH